MTARTDSFTLAPITNHDACSQLADALDVGRGHPFTINASQVQHVGGRVAQLLVLAKASWNAEEFDFEIIEPSAGFINSMQKLGLEQMIMAKG